MNRITKWFRKLICRFVGHDDKVPLIEIWESNSGWQKSAYLCRRCFIDIGEKPYA